MKNSITAITFLLKLLNDMIRYLSTLAENIDLADWKSLLEFRWTEKMTEYPDYYNRDYNTIIASDYSYEIKLEELDCDNNPLLLESNISGSSFSVTDNTFISGRQIIPMDGTNKI